MLRCFYLAQAFSFCFSTKAPVMHQFAFVTTISCYRHNEGACYSSACYAVSHLLGEFKDFFAPFWSLFIPRLTGSHRCNIDSDFTRRSGTFICRADLTIAIWKNEKSQENICVINVPTRPTDTWSPGPFVPDCELQLLQVFWKSALSSMREMLEVTVKTFLSFVWKL